MRTPTHDHDQHHDRHHDQHHDQQHDAHDGHHAGHHAGHEHDGWSPRGRLRRAVARRAARAGWQGGRMSDEDPRGGTPFGDPSRGPRGGRDEGPRGPRGGGPRGGPFRGPSGGGPFGGGPFGGGPFGGGPFGGPHGGPHHGGPSGPGGWGGRRGGRARRGDVRAAVLALLAEEPRNGYQLITEIEQRSGGAWKPSPGSVYPVLSQLEDEGLVTPSTEGGRKAFVLTEAGRTEAEARGGATPWDEAREDLGEGRAALMDGLRQVGGALWQVAGAGTPAQQREAAAILADTRSRLYRLLADGAEAERGTADASDAGGGVPADRVDDGTDGTDGTPGGAGA